MSETEAGFLALRQVAAPDAAAALEKLVHSGQDHELSRINPLHLARRTGLREDDAIDALLHGARLGIFDLSWNVLCPGCGGVMQASATLKMVRSDTYHCELCAAGYEPTLDEMVEVTFTVNPRLRRIAAHDPDSLPMPEYCRQLFWSSGVDLPDDFAAVIEGIVLDHLELPPGDRALLSLQLPPEFVIVFDPVTHSTQFLDIKGEPTRERQQVTFVIDDVAGHTEPIALRPGPLRLTIENRSPGRALPGVWVAGKGLHDLLGRRRPFLTAKRLLANQTFRDIHRTDTLDVEQRLKITSLTFLFTDLKGSTELYDRVGDLAAYDLVRSHFTLLHDIVAAEAGAVVKTIGDAVMATFPAPDRAVAAALRMRDAMAALNQERGSEDLLLKIGMHEGPCLAVSLNDRQDFFGQTVNIASRVQNLALSRSIFATGRVVENSQTRQLLAASGIEPTPHRAALRGVAAEVALYEIP
jgi:class 3 adenylate cyclase